MVEPLQKCYLAIVKAAFYDISRCFYRVLAI
jgi:hypothetical protein